MINNKLFQNTLKDETNFEHLLKILIIGLIILI